MLALRPLSSVAFAAQTNLSIARLSLRLSAWACAAMLALVLALAAGRTELGAQRAHAALTAMQSGPTGPDQQWSDQMAAWSNGFDRQMRRMTDIIRTLTQERDGLAEKVTVLERRLNDLGATVAQSTAKLEVEARSAQQAAAAAGAAAASATKLAQARQEPQPVLAAPAPAAALAATQSPASPPGAQAVAQAVPHAPAAQPAPPMAETAQPAPAPFPGQLRPRPPLAAAPPASAGPGAPVAPAGFPALPAATAATSSPTYTGTIPMPTATAADGAAAMAHPFPASGTGISFAAEPPAVQWPTPSPPHAGGGGGVPPARVPATVAAPLFNFNPLMTTGILEAPPAPGAIATEFAIDLGAAATIEAARARWNELQTANRRCSIISSL